MQKSSITATMEVSTNQSDAYLILNCTGNSTLNCSGGFPNGGGSSEWVFYFIIIFLILGTISILGNVTALVATCFVKTWRSYMIVFVSLSVSDTIASMAFIVVPIARVYGSQAMQETAWGNGLLQAGDILSELAYTASTFSLLGMALCRYIVICHPMQQMRILTKCAVYIYLACMWTISSLLTTPRIIQHLNPNTQAINFFYYINPPIYILVFITIIVLCLKVYYETRKVINNARTMQMTCEANEGRKAAITTLMMTGTLIMYSIPFWAFYTIVSLDLIKMNPLTEQWCYIVLQLLLILNYMSDPVIYTTRTKDIKRAYKVMLFKMCKCMGIKKYAGYQSAYNNNHSYSTEGRYTKV
ncbi:unnamed protein product [Owenia fusiformis]|uniref:Uncharacterized protein n=1 Tax=Owenia fusiformis TaxID=6347 RepID=A0A8J1UML1_OWEFU|nr:unnamed protein product [Owenia fusiformis]